MTAAEILAELPRLSSAELAQVEAKLREVIGQNRSTRSTHPQRVYSPHHAHPERARDFIKRVVELSPVQHESAKIVAQVCDLLLNQITDDHASAVVNITCDEHPDDRLSFFSYVVAIGLMPEVIQASMDQSIFQSVCRFFQGFSIVCERIEDSDCGICIRLRVPEKVDFSKAFQATKPKPA